MNTVSVAFCSVVVARCESSFMSSVYFVVFSLRTAPN